jgi:outer membrane receptor protein involved in Fe transport
LSGKVVDAKTGEPIAGAAVIIEGTKRGGITDVAGSYSVLFVPAGTYNVTSRVTGYRPETLTGVVILADLGGTADFRLQSEAIQQQEVRVTGERPLVERTATSTVRYKTGEEIQKLPTRGYQQVASLQSGVAQRGSNVADTEAQNAPSLYIRGGRSNEVAYYVDGFSQQDPLTGISTTAINNNAIDQVVVLTGGFNAEYGRAMSGAVNVITKEGGARYHGSLEAVSDNLSGTWISTNKYDNNIYSASFGGPLVPHGDNLTFYASGERRWYGDRAPHPLANDLQATLADLGYSDEHLPNNWLSGWTWQGKLRFRPNDKVDLKLGTLGSLDKWQQYRHEYLFDITHTPRYEDKNNSAFLSLTHQLATNTFHTLAANFSSTARKRGDGAYFDNLLQYGRTFSDPRYPTNLPYFYPGDDPSTAVVRDTIVELHYNNGFLNPPDTTYIYDFQETTSPDGTPSNEGNVWDDYLRRESSYWGARYDLTSQVNKKNQIKIGGDFQYHTLRFYQHVFPTTIYDDPATPRIYDSTGTYVSGNEIPLHFKDANFYGYDPLAQDHVDSGLNGAKHPITASIYAQDKIESEGIVVNTGLRFDYLAPRTERLQNELLPLGPKGDQPITANLVPAKAYTRVSPRIGIGFPVTDRTVFHLNYGKFYQQPNLQDLYVNYDYLAYKVAAFGYFYPFGNPNLKPETTTAYEVGFVHQLSDISRVDVAVYYKDIKDLVEVTTIPSLPASFSSYRNRDFGTTKGVDMQYTLRPAHHIAADLSYSFSFAAGTGSVSTTQRNIAWQYDPNTGVVPPKQTAPLDFDQRHKISASLDLRNGAGEGPVVGGTHILSNAGINLLFNAASGSPFTPAVVYDEVSQAAVAITPAGTINSRYGPWRYQLDLKANKDFRVGDQGLSAYFWIINVFDRRNPVAVYSSSGSPETTYYLNTSNGQANLAADPTFGETYRLAEHNPTLYDTPRMVRFGLRADF